MRLVARRLTQVALLFGVVVCVTFLLDGGGQSVVTSVHNHLPIHHLGFFVTDITFVTCSKVSVLSGITGCAIEPNTGWYSNGKDVFLGEDWIRHGFVQVKRIKEDMLATNEKVVVDVRIGRIPPSTSSKSESWEARPGGIWLLFGKPSDQAISGVDVLFGHDALEPRPAWSLRGYLLYGKDAQLSIQRGPPPIIEKPTLRIPKSGKFKILQLADLHLTTGLGICRDAEPPETRSNCEADVRTMEFVERILDEEKPDLVVMTGDQVNDNSLDVQSAIFKAVAPLIAREIPYACIFGNHDDEGNISRQQHMQILESLPFSLSESGLGSAEGIGNYVVNVKAPKSDHNAISLYFLDTHGYSPDDREHPGYDWIKDSQIRWFKDQRAALASEAQRYTHIHMQLAFMHIPLPEYRIQTNPFVGSWLEPPTAPTLNTNFRDVLAEAGVSAVFCGHDHANDYCMFDKSGTQEQQIWLCYGGGAGFGGYGGYGGYTRRVRLLEIETGPDRITTWKRLEYGDIRANLDKQTLVEAGSILPMGPK